MVNHLEAGDFFFFFRASLIVIFLYGLHLRNPLNILSFDELQDNKVYLGITSNKIYFFLSNNAKIINKS